MQLLVISFTGTINIGSSIPCSKYEFGIQFAENFEFEKSLINKDSIADHDFDSPRFNNLMLNMEKISDLGIRVPDYRESIKIF